MARNHWIDNAFFGEKLLTKSERNEITIACMLLSCVFGFFVRLFVRLAEKPFKKRFITIYTQILGHELLCKHKIVINI